MPHSWTCPRGHHWHTDEASAGATAPRCPFCAAVAVNPAEPPEETLQRPAPSGPRPAAAAPFEETLTGVSVPRSQPGAAPEFRQRPPASAAGLPPADLDAPTKKVPPPAPPAAPPDVPTNKESSPHPGAHDATLPPPAGPPRGSVGSVPPTAVPGPGGETGTRLGVSILRPTDHGVPAPTALPSAADDEPGDTLQRRGPADGPGTRRKEHAAVSGYEILDILGRGGMGVVYKARQVALNRLVALKMILAAGHAGAEDLARFQVEAEAVARLQHPNIVQVFEVGQRDHLPFFSLEFVEGGSLAQKLVGTPMPIREAAALIETLARAMHYAHQQHIVHRDLKPANILLTRDGVPKITDFGLAKRLEEGVEHTGTGAILGTPTYMAPEQAQGRTHDIGPPCDIYALGAILYDLLTGRPPFKGTTILDTLQLLQTVEPVPVRRLQPKVPRDLETITLKCLQKEPKKRYASAGDLADDLKRFLAGEPILARPTPAWERVVKWARRRPALATLVGVSFIALVSLLTLGALWLDTARRAAEEREEQQTQLMLVERQRAEKEASLRAEADTQRQIALKQTAAAKRERNEAVRQKGVADEQRRRADAHLHRAFEAGDALLTRAQARLSSVPGMEGVRRELLEKALAFYQGFFDIEGDTPEVRLQTGLAHHRVGTIEEQFGQYPRALRSYDAALALLRRAADERPRDADRLFAVATGHMDRAHVLQALNRPAEAERAYADAVAAGRKLVEVSRGPRYRRQLAASLNSWAGHLGRAPARRGEAEKAYQEAIAVLDRLCTDYPEEAQYRSEKARVLADLGVLLQASAPRRAEAAMAQALALQQKLAADAPDVPEYRLEEARTLLNLAVVWELGRQPKRAAKACTDAAALLERLVADFARATDYRHQLARAYTQLGLLLETNNEFDRAEEFRRKARAHWERLVADTGGRPEFRQELARSRTDLGRHLQRGGAAEKAEAAWGEAVKLQEQLVKEFPDNAEYRMDLARSHIDLGQLLGLRRQTENEEEHYRRAIALLDEARGKSVAPPAGWLGLRVNVQHNLVGALLERKQWAKGAEALREAIRHQREAAAVAPEDVGQRQRLASYYVGLMDVLATQGDHAGVCHWAKEYEPLLRQAGASAGKDFVQAAGLVARCVGLAEGDAKLSAARRKELVQSYGDQAMGLLREGVRRGYRDAARLREAANFQALAGRADFRKLLSELGTKQDGGQR